MSEVEKALRSMPLAPDRIEVVLTLTPDEYRELGQSLQKFATVLAGPKPPQTLSSSWNLPRTLLSMERQTMA
jgi:hypothetical protein